MPPASEPTFTIPIVIGNIVQQRIIMLTTAPKNYDGFGTFTVYDYGSTIDFDGFETKHPARLVAVLPEHLGWHECRYSSGLYLCSTQLKSLRLRQQDIELILFKRLTANDQNE